MRVWRLPAAVASGCLALVVCVFALPRAAGAAWGDIAAAVSSTAIPQLAVMAVVWALGLVAYSTVLMAALPGLSRGRALTLNVTGSAISNVVPLGGAVAVGLNYRMVRTWGFSGRAFATFAVVSHAVNVAAKLALPLVALAVLALAGSVPDPRLTSVALASAVAVALAGAVVVLCRRAGATPGVAVSWAGRLRAGVAEVIRAAVRTTSDGGRRLTLGMVTYSALQLALLGLAVRAVHEPVAPAVVFAAYAVERALSLVPVTPGGIGVIEVGMTGLLVAVGGPPAESAAAVLVYRAFVFGLEIPVGGAWLLSWLWSQRGLDRPGREHARAARTPEVSCASST